MNVKADSVVKTRPLLPQAYRAIYETHYRENRDGGSPAAGVARRLERWMHRAIAEDALESNPGPTLEIGAGTLNQLPYEPHSTPYDVVEPFEALYLDSPLLNRVRHIYRDITDVPTTSRYARLTSIATFEHLTDLRGTVRACAGLLAPGGQLRVANPNEGHWPWTAAWRIGTGLEFWLRHGLDYGVLMRHEHLNTADEIGAELRAVFKSVEERWFGLSRTVSLYRVFIATGV
jgi:hypothetical protein